MAVVGLDPAAAERAGRRVRVGKFPFAANGRALAGGETDGFVKVLADAESGELLGVVARITFLDAFMSRLEYSSPEWGSR